VQVDEERFVIGVLECEMPVDVGALRWAVPAQPHQDGGGGEAGVGATGHQLCPGQLQLVGGDHRSGSAAQLVVDCVDLHHLDGASGAGESGAADDKDSYGSGCGGLSLVNG
jgi:hypothetical protein